MFREIMASNICTAYVVINYTYRMFGVSFYVSTIILYLTTVMKDVLVKVHKYYQYNLLLNYKSIKSKSNYYTGIYITAALVCNI